jgi:hypothetical protein
LYGGETWSLTLREGNRLRVFENRVSRKIFGPKKKEVTRCWRKFHNEELHDLYSSLDIIIEEGEMGRACSMHGDKRSDKHYR